MTSCVARTVCTRFRAANLQADEQRIAGDAVERGKWLVEQEQTRARARAPAPKPRAAPGRRRDPAGGERRGRLRRRDPASPPRGGRGGASRGCAGHRPRWRRRSGEGRARAAARPARFGDGRAAGGLRCAVSVSARPSRAMRPRSGPVEAGEQAQQRALACAGGAEDHGPIGGEAALHLEVEAAAARVERELKHRGLRALRGLWLVE